MALDGEEEPLTGSARAAKPADRWPWVFVGVMLGLAAALIFTHGGSAAGMLGAPQETTCGGFPSTDPGHVVQPRDGRVTNVLVTGEFAP